MDDFLHNLRSGKLKQGDRSNRPYNDQQFKGGQRRNNNMMDRRKPHFENKESSERMNAIKEVLDNLAETQKRMAEASMARTRIEERKAKAMEVLAKNLYRMLNPNATAGDIEALFATESLPTIEEEAAPVENLRPSMPIHTEPDPVVDTPEEVNAFAAEADEVDESASESDAIGEEDDFSDSAGRLTEVDRHTLLAVINQMRDDGHGWEKIARHISAQGYPTISGKGNWRGVMVKTLYDKMVSP
ncbi:MAG: hypothetical protein WAU91_04525 [Desulfatitalea sp.]